MDYAYETKIAIDGNGNIARATTGQVFALADELATNPLIVRDPDGIARSFVAADTTGLLQDFIVTGHPKVVWRSGQFAIILASPDGLLEEAKAARADAQTAAAQVAAYGNTNDTLVSGFLADSGSATRSALYSYFGGSALNMFDTLGDFDRERFGGTRITRAGSEALKSWTSDAYHNEAYGRRALYSLTKGNWNSAFGGDALYSLDGAGESDPYAATRNVSLGWNSSRFNKNGYETVVAGRNSLQCAVDPKGVVSIGAGSMSRQATYGFSGQIENQMPSVGKIGIVSVGYNALSWSDASYLTANGYEALKWSKLGEANTVSGYRGFTNLEYPLGYNGYPQDLVNLSPSFVFNGMQVNCTLTGHGILLGDIVKIGFGISPFTTLYLSVIAVTANTFTLETRGYNAGTGSGTASITAIIRMSQPAPAPSSGNTGMGSNVGVNLLSARDVTAMGVDALRYMSNGSNATDLINATGVGARAAVAGNNQVQLGDSATTTFTYGAVQSRSDARDKTDIRDTRLGLDFVMALRPVDFRWKYREDGGQTVRNRHHHGFIAQDIEQWIDKTGIDFGGYQDQSINGGVDVKTLGDAEFTAPIVKALQQIAVRVFALEEAAA